MDITLITNLAGLLILSVVDLMTYDNKKKYIPSIMTSTFLFISAIVSRNIYMIIIAALLGLMLSDLSLWKGIADYKTYVAVGMTMSNIIDLLIFTAAMVVIGTIISYVLNKYHKKEMPYIPIILIGWILTMVIL